MASDNSSESQESQLNDERNQARQGEASEQDNQPTSEQAGQQSPSYAKMIKIAQGASDSAKDLAQQAANKVLQKGLDQAKQWLLPMSIWVLPIFAVLVIINVELFLPIFRKSFTLALWRKVLYLAIDFLILFFILTIVGLFSYAKQYPAETCALIGTAVAGPIGTAVGWVKGTAGDCF